MDSQTPDLASFLKSKRIDPEKFAAANPELWTMYTKWLTELGPKSFDQQLKFYFNPWRLTYPLSIEESEK